MNRRVLLGMSGGLDSSYSALVLKNEGYEVFGTTLIMHEFTDTTGARECADSLSVPFSVLDLRDEFDKKVKIYFADEYACGRTPNPCVVCNRNVKFAGLVSEADSLGCDFVATGHYAGIRNENGRYFVVRGLDPKKDQSYMLWSLSQDQLKRIIFPLEKRMKTDVRKDARDAGLSSADIAESEDVCFLPDEEATDFVHRMKGNLPEGDFVDVSGKVIGRHKGIASYTIGQRRGLGISAGKRIFVTDIDPVKNVVTVGDDADLYKSDITVRGLNFQKLAPTENGEFRFDVKVRYAAPAAGAFVKIEGDTAKVHFDTPVRASAPGQSAVFYDGDAIAFGGVIEREMRQ